MIEQDRRLLLTQTEEVRVLVLGGGTAGLSFAQKFLDGLTGVIGEMNPLAIIEERKTLGGRSNPYDPAHLDSPCPDMQLSLPLSIPEISGPEQVGAYHRVLSSLLNFNRRSRGNNSQHCSRRYTPQIWFAADDGWIQVDNLEAQADDRFRKAFIRLEAGVPPEGRYSKLLEDPNYSAEIFAEYWDEKNGCYAEGFGARTFKSTCLVQDLSETVVNSGGIVQVGSHVQRIFSKDGLWVVETTNGSCFTNWRCQSLVLAVPSWKLCKLQFEDPEISKLLEDLSELLPGTRWPAKVVLELDAEMKFDGYQELFIIGSWFCAQLWPHYDTRTALSGIVAPIEGTELNRKELFLGLVSFFRHHGINLSGCYILNISEVFGGAYTFYPGKEIYNECVKPKIEVLRGDYRIYPIGDYVDYGMFGHAEAAVKSAIDTALDLKKMITK